jgi:hypothetical protein
MTACAAGQGTLGNGAKPALLQTEDFSSSTTHTRAFVASPAQACEAARRALLSQGYVTSATGPDLVSGRKNFQPESEVHVEVEFRIVCAPDSPGGATTIAFVTALQDRFALKKVNNSASLGVGAFGSLSLPFSSSDDAMVKVASETIAGSRFYERFFQLMLHYMPPPAAAPTEAAVASPVTP